MAARQGDATAVKELAARALALDPDNAVASSAIAASEIETGDAGAAVARLQAVLSHSAMTPEDRIAALTLFGDAHDKCDAPSAAFAAWSTAQATYAAFHARRFADREPQRKFIERLAARIASVDGARWRTRTAPEGHEPARGHVFLLGYPRSGTTLVENILAGARDVVAIEERPTFATPTIS